MSEKSIYRGIVKSSSVFGGVQVIQIFVNIIRAKFVAILLGPAGMGTSTLFLSSLNIINMFSALGINYSAVREISKSYESDDKNNAAKTISIFRRWLIFTSVLGALITAVFAPQLSIYTFGNDEYKWHFVFLSVFVFFTLFNGGNIALLRGARRIKDMGMTSVLSAFVGILSALPLYYYFGMNGIVPAIIIGALFNYIISSYYIRKMKIVKVPLSNREAFYGGIDMVKLGVALMAASFLGALTVFGINSFIRTYGSIEDVGLYQAGITLTNRYIGIILTAMSMDFFPRLSAISDDNTKVRTMVNQQAEVTILAAAPILTAMILLAPVVINVLLTKEFIVLSSFIRWTSFAMIMRSAATAVGYISFSKGDRKVFMLLEGIGSNSLTITGTIIGYIINGLEGVAIAIILIQLTYLLGISVFAYKRYDFYFNIKFIRLFLILISIASVVLAILTIYDNLYGYVVATALTILSIIICLHGFNKRIGIREIVSKYI